MQTKKTSLPYINRELSWMDFNARVLEEATRKDNPLMERIRFLAITASNLDEFFMVRVAGVKRQVNSGYNKPDDSGLTPKELLEALDEKTHRFMDRQYSCLMRSILPLLEKQGISFVVPSDMSSEQLDFSTAYFHEILFPVLTPLAVDGSRPFPMLANKTLNIAVRLKEKGSDKNSENFFAIVQVPSILPRFLHLPGPGNRYLLLEDLIIHHLDALFELHDIKAAAPFRVTRNADLDIDEDAEDFMYEVQKSIKKRKRGRPVRMELPIGTDKSTKKFLIDMLRIKPREIYEMSGPIDLTFLTKFASQDSFSEFSFQPVVPVIPADFYECEDIFAHIRKKDRLVYHPYERFDCVTDFIRSAAEDANVLAIKQTLYRVSGHSPIIAALIQAAENGKQVTVLVELKARFDEENNIQWAKKLEKAGCHVIYGLHGLKTHSKISLVVRQEADGIRRYLHLGTGNYNDSTAKIYTDIGMFTCDSAFGMDASSLFNVITGYSRPPEYFRFVVAPQNMRSFFISCIRREAENAAAGKPAGIIAKVNALVDAEIISELYKASQSGVSIRLIVRGICCLIPGREGFSENISVISIVGQLLEHSRIFKFENNTDPQVYVGSADWMPRNLDRRIELVFPVIEEDLKKRMIRILDVHLADNTNARIMMPDGSYQHVNRRGQPAFSSQQHFYQSAKARLSALQSREKAEALTPIHSSDI